MTGEPPRVSSRRTGLEEELSVLQPELRLEPQRGSSSTPRRDWSRSGSTPSSAGCEPAKPIDPILIGDRDQMGHLVGGKLAPAVPSGRRGRDTASHPSARTPQWRRSAAIRAQHQERPTSLLLGQILNRNGQSWNSRLGWHPDRRLPVVALGFRGATPGERRLPHI